MEFTGERMIPELNKGNTIYGEHYVRYIFSAQFAEGKRVLDIACGSGYGAKLLAESGAKKVYGVDISPKAIGYAQKTYPHPKVKFSVGDAQKIPLPDRSVEVVISMETIEHVGDYKKFLEEVKRVLGEGGSFVVSTPNKEIYEKQRGEMGPNPYHIKEFSIGEFETFLKNYFKNVNLFYQYNWASSTIMGEESISKEDILGEHKIHTTKSSDRSPEECLYIIALCSDDTLPAKVSEESLIFNVYEWEKMWSEFRILSDEASRLRSELDSIYNSRAWKLLTILRKIKYSIPWVRNL